MTDSQINSDLVTSGLMDGDVVRNVYIQSNGYLHNQGWGNDLNNARRVGSYHCSNNESNLLQNAPLGDGWGTVHVLANGSSGARVIQFFTYWNANEGDIFVRTSAGSTGWNPWKKLATEDIN